MRPMVPRRRLPGYPLDKGYSWGSNGAMARLSERGRRGLEQLRLVAADASSAELLAERALAAVDSAVPFDDGALFALDGSSLLFTRVLAYRGAEPSAMRGWIRDIYLVAREPGSCLTPVTPAPAGRPPAGQLMFDEQRHLVSLSASGQRWLALLAPDAVSPEVPVAVQALVGHLAGSGRSAGALTAVDRDGGRVAVRAEPALQLDASGAPARGYAVSVAAAPLVPGEPGLTGAQWAVARAVARGDSDREIAAALHLAPATVHEHVAALHRVLGTGTRPRFVAALASTVHDDH